MGTTIDDINYDMHLQEEWEDERRSVFEALEKIANSGNVDELIKNLEELKGVYISDKSIGNENLNKVIDNINFEMPKFKEYFDRQNKKNNDVNKKYFYIGLTIGILGLIIGIIGFYRCYT